MKLRRSKQLGYFKDWLHRLDQQNDMPRVKIDPFDITNEEYDLFQDNQLSLYEILDDRFAKDQLNIYIDE